MLYTIFIGIDSCQYRIFKTYRVIFHFPALIIKIFILLKQCLFVFCSMSYFLLSKKEEESRERVSWTRILLLWVLFFFLFFILIFILFYFTILYWFCHTLTWICHRCTWVPIPESCQYMAKPIQYCKVK